MIQLSKLAPGERALDELARFVGALNRDEAHQIGYLDADPAQIAKMLLERKLPPHESWVVAREDGRMVGALGFEADNELGRAWIYGPFALAPHPPTPSPTGGEGEIPAPLSLGVGDKRSATQRVPGELDGGWGGNPWATIADQLWEAAQALLPDGLREHELFCNVHNANCIAFAEWHAFPLHGDALIFRFGRESLASLPASEARELTDEHSAAFQALHDQIFPRTYLSGRQILERRNEHRKLFAIVEDDVLLGYAYVEIVPEFGEGNLEFIGVSEQARARRRRAADGDDAAMDVFFPEHERDFSDDQLDEYSGDRAVSQGWFPTAAYDAHIPKNTMRDQRTKNREQRVERFCSLFSVLCP